MTYKTMIKTYSFDAKKLVLPKEYCYKFYKLKAHFIQGDVPCRHADTIQLL